MTFTDVGAVMGAIAGGIQISWSLWYLFSKSKVTIRSDKYASIGFTSLGPIFNLRLALCTEVKKVIANNIRVTITHEKGNTLEFECTGLQEKFSENLSSEGHKQVVGRDTSPLMIMLNQDSVNDAFFRFQQLGFFDARSKYISQLVKLENSLRKMNRPSPEIEFLESKECNDYIGFMRSNFCWLSGTYKIQIAIEGTSSIKLLNSTIEMNLTQDEVDRLRINLDLLKDELSWWMKPTPERGQLPMWNWLDIRLS